MIRKFLALCVLLSFLLFCLFGSGLALAATGAAAVASPDPIGWVASHWTSIVTAVAAFLVVHYVRRIDKKFDILFDWKLGVDRMIGVHDQVWGHGDGCGPVWIHHRGDGISAVHYREGDHPGLCEACREGLRGSVVAKRPGWAVQPKAADNGRKGGD